jgi:hypothetical protein
VAQVRAEADQGVAVPARLLPVQQRQGLQGAEAGGAVPRRPHHPHRQLHRRAQPSVPLHRNSLAGTTRNKPQPPSSTSAGEEPPQPRVESSTGGKQQGSPSASAGLSPTTPLHYCPPAGVEHEEEVEEEAVAAILLLEDAEMEVGGAHPPGSAPV